MVTDEVADEVIEAGTDEATDVGGTEDSALPDSPGKAADNSQPSPNSAATQTTINNIVSHGRFFLYIYFDRLTFMGGTSYNLL